MRFNIHRSIFESYFHRKNIPSKCHEMIGLLKSVEADEEFWNALRAIAFELNLGAAFEEAIAELNILNVDMEEYDVYLYYETGDVLHRYNYRCDLNL